LRASPALRKHPARDDIEPVKALPVEALCRRFDPAAFAFETTAEPEQPDARSIARSKAMMLSLTIFNYLQRQYG
jgi:hypothetical protein